MRMREVGFGEQRPVEGYGPGGFRIGADWYAGAVLLGPDGVEAMADPLGPAAVARLVALAGRIDLVLVGTGAEIGALPAAFCRALEAAGLGVEAMATPPACRTYNVLLSESRRVAVLLRPV